MEELLASKEAQGVLVLRDIEDRRLQIQSVIRSRLAQHNQYTSRHVVLMEKCLRQMKFYWKMVKPEKSVDKDDSQEYNETNSQGGVEENEEDDTISEKQDDNESHEGKEGSEEGSEI